MIRSRTMAIGVWAVMWSGGVLASDSVIRPECSDIASDALSPTAAAEYYREVAKSDGKILSNGQEPLSKAEVILKLMSIEGSYGNSAVLTTNQSSWVLDWEKEKASYAFKLSVPFDFFQKWNRAGRARAAAEESIMRAKAERRVEFIGKFLGLRRAIEKKEASESTDIIALQIAADSPTFAGRCIVQTWLPALPTNEKDLPF